MRGTRLLAGFIAFTAFFLFGSAVEAAQRAVVELTDGSRVEGEILKRGDELIHIAVGASILSIERAEVAAIQTEEGGPEKPKDLEEHRLYRTARLPVKPVSALADRLGPAIVTVRTPAGMGTGWFCSPDGYLITNNHVVAQEQSITVTAFRREQGRFEKKVYRKVKLIALDEYMDLALLKVEEDLEMDIPQLYLGDSDTIQEGDEVFTIGNPQGLERSTARGDVSKVNRNYQGRLYIQTTTPISPGNSGGPLFNERGEVIGVTNMGYIFLDGLGFAIPSRYVKEFLDNVEAFAYDPDNPNAAIKYMEPPVTAEDGSIAFTDAEFVKAGHGLSCLTLADINDDGVEEVVFVNNMKAEIGVLRLREEGERERRAADFEDINQLPESDLFKLDTHAVNNKISSLVVEDMNDDGRPDILFRGDIDGLAVLEQQEDGSFGSPRRIADVEVSERTDALHVVDLDGDGTKETVALGTKELHVFGEGARQDAYALNAGYRDSITDFELMDVTGDERLDVVFFCRGQNYATYVLVQNAHGEFSEEVLVESHLSGPTEPFENGAAGHRFLTLDKGKNRVRELMLEHQRVAEREGVISVVPRAIPLATEEGTGGQFEIEDLDGDGRQEILTVNKGDNEFVVLRADEGGYRRHSSPSPKNVEGLELLQLEDGRVALFSFSSDDQIFGVSRVEGSGVSFPRPINAEGTVQWLWLGRVDGESILVWVEKDERDYLLRATGAEELARKAFDGEKGSIDVDAQTLLFGETEEELEAQLPGKPDRVSFADFNSDGKADLVIHWSYSGKESLYLGQGEGRYKPIIKDQEFLQEQKDQPLLVADIDGDGDEDVLLVQSGFVRVLRVDQKGKLYVDRQFNWEFDEVSRMVPYGGDGARRFLALAGSKARLVEFDVENSRFRLVATIDLRGLQPGRLEVADLDGNDLPDIIVMGSNALQMLYRRDERRALRARTVLDARLDYFTYWNLHPADLDGDGRDEVMLFDSKKAMFEVYRPGGGGELEPVLRHRLFEKSIHQRGEADSLQLPQELAIGDVDDNGSNDAVFILQDRIAVYLQNTREVPGELAAADE
jgi:serine protease Do